MEPIPQTRRARRYNRRRLALQLVHYASFVAFLLLLVLTPLGRRFEAMALAPAAGRWVALILYAGLVGFAWSLLMVPLEVCGYRLERSHGLTETAPLSQVWVSLKARLIGAALGLPLLAAFYACLLAWPRHWWLPVGGILFLFGIILARLAPTLLLPLFVTQEPMEEGPLAERLRRMSAAEGVDVVDLYRVGLSRLTLKATAAFAGLGRTRRILMGDTLLDHFEEDEIEAVVAHELGHRCLHHIPRGILVGFFINVIGLALAAWAYRFLLPVAGYEDPRRLAALPLLALVLVFYGVLAAPVQNAAWRGWEFAADRFAAQRTSPEALAAALRRLGEMNLADPDPPRLEEVLFHGHPSLNRRIAALGKE